MIDAYHLSVCVTYPRLLCTQFFGDLRIPCFFRNSGNRLKTLQGKNRNRKTQSANWKTRCIFPPFSSFSPFFFLVRHILWSSPYYFPISPIFCHSPLIFPLFPQFSTVFHALPLFSEGYLCFGGFRTRVHRRLACAHGDKGMGREVGNWIWGTTRVYAHSLACGL